MYSDWFLYPKKWAIFGWKKMPISSNNKELNDRKINDDAKTEFLPSLKFSLNNLKNEVSMPNDPTTINNAA